MNIRYGTLCLFVIIFCGSCKTQYKSTSAGGEQSAKNELVLRLNPGANNPRNSEGAFITLKDKRILFVYSKYMGRGSGDHDPAFLAGRTSADGGKTWSEKDEVIIEKEGAMNVMSVSLLRLKNGNIALFYLKKNSTSDCIPLMRISEDEARTWTEPVKCITDKQGYFVLNNDRVIQLTNGRLLMAVALHSTPEFKWRDKAELWTYYSDDNGQTWKSGKQVPTPEKIVTQEPGVVELRNGDIMMFIRSNSGKQLVSYSNDKGISWSLAEQSSINSPLSPASIKRIPNTQDLLLVWNNNDGTQPDIKGERTPLAAAISKDEGKTWQNVKMIESDPDGWYCYIAIHFYKNEVLLGYCAGSQSKRTHLSATNITRVPVQWLYK